MPTPDQGALLPLPKTLTAKPICVTLQIPSDQESISNFIGALYTLALWNSYQRDAAKTGRVVAQQWKTIISEMLFYNCDAPPGAGGGCGEDCDGMCCLRVENGKLQQLVCGVWTTIPGGDLAAIVGPGVQQPPPGGTLEPGDCQEYDVTLYGSNTYLLPITVSEGNTVEISVATGGWSDGDSVGPFGAAWSCPSGQVYALGSCGAPNGPGVDDPLPSADHMRLIARVGADYYDAYNTTITAPIGATDLPVLFQANDATLANNLGSITFHVKICNSAVATWCYEWDFETQSGPLLPYHADGIDYAVYGPGLGWYNEISSGDSQMTIVLNFNMQTCTYVEYDLLVSGSIGTSHSELQNPAGSVYYVTRNPLTDGLLTISGAVVDPESTLWLNAFNSAEASQNLILKRLKISGKGEGPLGPSTC